MAVFATTAQLYTCFDAVFSQVRDRHPHAAETIAGSGLNFRFRTTAPDGIIVIEGRRRPPETYFGVTPGKVDLDIYLSADTLHEILLGELGVTKAIGQRKLTVKGPALKALALKELFYHSQSVYPQILAANGLG